MLKQRVLVQRPENQDDAIKERRRLEYFGWLCVSEDANDDGSINYTYMRDDEECADKVEREHDYRSAKLAAAYARQATEKLQGLSGKSNQKKMGSVGAIIAFVLALIFAAGIVVALVWSDLYEMLFPKRVILGGKWSFFGHYFFASYGASLVAAQLLIILAFASLSLLFIFIGLSGVMKNSERSLASADYADFILDELEYFDELDEKATAEAVAIYSEYGTNE